MKLFKNLALFSKLAFLAFFFLLFFFLSFRIFHFVFCPLLIFHLFLFSSLFFYSSAIKTASIYTHTHKRALKRCVSPFLYYPYFPIITGPFFSFYFFFPFFFLFIPLCLFFSLPLAPIRETRQRDVKRELGRVSSDDDYRVYFH